MERYETVLPRELPVPRGKRDLSAPPVSPGDLPGGMQPAGTLSHHQAQSRTLDQHFGQTPQPCTQRRMCCTFPCLGDAGAVDQISFSGLFWV